MIRGQGEQGPQPNPRIQTRFSIIGSGIHRPDKLSARFILRRTCSWAYCISRTTQISAQPQSWLHESTCDADAFEVGERGVFGGQQEVAHKGRIEHVGPDSGVQSGKQAFFAQTFGRHVAT